jgi:hypothetical protein
MGMGLGEGAGVTTIIEGCEDGSEEVFVGVEVAAGLPLLSRLKQL